MKKIIVNVQYKILSIPSKNEETLGSMIKDLLGRLDEEGKMALYYAVFGNNERDIVHDFLHNKEPKIFNESKVMYYCRKSDQCPISCLYHGDKFLENGQDVNLRFGINGKLYYVLVNKTLEPVGMFTDKTLHMMVKRKEDSEALYIENPTNRVPIEKLFKMTKDDHGQWKATQIIVQDWINTHHVNLKEFFRTAKEDRDAEDSARSVRLAQQLQAAVGGQNDGVEEAAGGGQNDGFEEAAGGGQNDGFEEEEGQNDGEQYLHLTFLELFYNLYRFRDG